MPTITYKGPFYERKSPDSKVRAFRRMEERHVTQKWLDTHRRKISEEHYLIEGDEGVHFDEANDGIPDMSWTKAKIVEWLEDNGSSVGGGYRTKSKLLDMVEGVLNPVPVAEPVAEEAVEEIPVEEAVETTEIMEE